MTTSLRLERNPAFEGPEFRGNLCNLWLDGTLISERAGGFDASTPHIALSQCEECGLCGHQDVAVRRLGEYVLWIDRIDPNWKGTHLKPHEFRLFHAEDYMAALGGKCSALPEASAAELNRLVSAQTFPAWLDALYVLPDFPADPDGHLILQAVCRAPKNNFQGLIVRGAADSIGKLQIGLAEPEGAETVVELGRIAGLAALRFHEIPAFPLWFTTPQLAADLEPLLPPNAISTGGDHNVGGS